MSDGLVQHIPWETPDPEHMSLGRSIRHDPASRGFALPRGTVTGDIRHRNYGRKLYQDGIGACTCFTAAHAVNSSPLRQLRKPAKTLTATNAFELYRFASANDPWPGAWEPDDTGSSGLAACKALINAGYATGYQWAFGYDHGLASLPDGPLMQGTWWTEDMFTPDSTGRVRPTGRDSGGHEYLWIGSEEYGRRPTGGSRRRRSWFLNSWQESSRRQWGENGYFWMDEDDHRALLERDGDLVRPTIT